MNTPEPWPQLGYVPAADGAPLYVAWHVPTGPARAPVVIAPPLFEERKSAYAALQRLAAKLAAAGHPVLRFDYRGSGESGGDSSARRWADMAADLATARDTAAKLAGCEEVVLLGLRMGATLVLHEAARLNAARVIALAPLINGATQVRLWKMRSKIRSELTQAAASASETRDPKPETRNPSVDFDGYAVHPAFFDDVAALDLLKECQPLEFPALLVQISHKTAVAPECTKLQAALGPRCALSALRLEPFWDKLDDVDTAPLEDLVLKALDHA